LIRGPVELRAREAPARIQHLGVLEYSHRAKQIPHLLLPLIHTRLDEIAGQAVPSERTGRTYMAIAAFSDMG